MQTLAESSVAYWLESAERFDEGVSFAESVTHAYREAGPDPLAREAAVLKAQFARMFLPMEAGDAFAGRVRYGHVGLSPEPVSLGYYCVAEALAEGAERYPALAERARALIGFWAGRTTREKVRAAYPPEVTATLPSDAWTEESGVAFPLYRMAGTTLDYVMLLKRGLDGLEALSQGTPFAHVVPLYRGTLDAYADAAPDASVAETLRAIRHRPPSTFREATQLFWLYALHAGTWNYGRLDVALGPYLDADLRAGSITEEEALDWLASLWRLMHAYDNQYNNRLFIGGKGRPNEEAADRFALLAIEATRRVRLNQPQLSMRFYAGQNPELWERALDAIGEGCTYPMLYNDDVNIPAVARAFEVSESEAEQYTPFGCGEYVLGSLSVGSPNGVINLLKALEVALHGGVDPWTGRRVQDLPGPESFGDFEALWSAYAAVVERHVAACARQEKIEYDVTAEEAPFGFISLLTHDCLERGRGAFAGGVRYLGGTLETYGNTNAGDSLHVIDELVFRQNALSLREFVAALDVNFEGREALLARCRAVRKYGNDEGPADLMAVRVHEHVCGAVREQADLAGLHSYLVVIINNWANTVLGWKTGASAEGRLSGQPMANGNNPAPGADVSGATAFLNSLIRLDPSIHAGAVQNMKFTREWFDGGLRPKFDALLRGYFEQGGTQAMITVVSRDDLEAAMREPEKWGHLMVRVGGFSIRFIELPYDAQLELLARTLH